MKFLVTFAIFADFLRFLQAISIKHIFAKLRQIAIVVFRNFAILLEFFLFLLYLLFFLYISDSSFNFFLPKLRKQFATKFLREYSILDTRGEPQGSITQLFQPF